MKNIDETAGLQIGHISTSKLVKKRQPPTKLGAAGPLNHLGLRPKSVYLSTKSCLPKSKF
jgi:hypothetical protein